MMWRAVLTYSTTEMMADEQTKATATKHTHEVPAKSTCKFGAHDKMLACLGVEEYSGNECGQLSEKIARERFSLRGAELGQGQNGHFQNEIT